MEPALKILVIPSWYPPDGGYFFKEHSEALASAGCRVDVLVNRWLGIRKVISAGTGSLKSHGFDKEADLGVYRSVYPKIPGCEKLNTRRWIASTSRLFDRYMYERGKPDLILAHSAIWAGCASGKISELYGIPYIITEHRGIILPGSSDRMPAFYKGMIRKAYMKATQLIAVSGPMKEGISAIIPEAGNKTVVIPNMVNTDLFRLPESTTTSGPFIFITAGRLIKMKRYDLLLKAFSSLTGQKEARLRILGKGPERERLEALSDALGIRDKVEFTGRLSREEISRAYREADCFVLSSEYESFGVVLIEAMASGLPLIATQCGGPETIVNKQNGYLVKPGDEAALKDAMLGILDEQDRFDRNKIRIEALERYGHYEITKRYIEIFKKSLHLHG